MNALKRNRYKDKDTKIKNYMMLKGQNVQKCGESLELIKPNCEKSDWSEGYNKKAQW